MADVDRGKVPGGPSGSGFVSGVAELEGAVSASVAALGGAAPDAQGEGERVARAGATAIDILRRFEADPCSARPPLGSQADPFREVRHDVRAAAQTVLAQLELIALGWPSWDQASRGGMLDELEEAVGELERMVQQAIG